MNISTKLPISISLIAALSASVSAQTTESVILYNSQAVKVELSEVGTILSFYGLMPGYMDGYDLGQANELAAVELPTESMIDVEDQNFGKNAEYDVISKERVQMSFTSNFATLSNETIAALDQVAARLKKGDHSKVLITAYSTDGQANTLVSNRINAVKSYLFIKGISSSNILIEVQGSSSLLDSVTVNFAD